MHQSNKRNLTQTVIIILLCAVVIAGAVLFFALRRQDTKQPDDGGQVLSADDSAAEPETQPEPEKVILIGGTEYSGLEESLHPENTGFDELFNAVSSFPNLKSLDLSELELSNDEIGRILQAVPDAEVTYSARISGDSYPCGTEDIDLSAYSEADADELVSALKILPSVKTVTLPKENEANSFPFMLIAQLCDAAPQADFIYSFSLFGKTVSLEDTGLEYHNVEIGNDGLDVFYNVLPCMKKLERLVLEDCGTDNEAMAALRDAFPDISVVWRVYWNNFSALTDAKIIRAVGTKTDKSTDALKYCTAARFIDFGHSTELTNVDFARYMPELQILIVVDSAIESIEPLSECKNLTLLEIVNCWQLKDIDPLAECTKLRFLNFSNAFLVKDLSPIFELPELERVYASAYKVPEEQIAELKSLHPDCWVSFGPPEPSAVSKNYSVGWRLDAAPKEFADWYVEMRKIFGIGWDLYGSDGYYSYRNAKPYDFPFDELEIFTLD